MKMIASVKEVSRSAGDNSLSVARPNTEVNGNFLAISGSELRDMLYPIAPETYFTEYWGRKPLFIKGGPDKLQKLFPGGFSVKDFHKAVREAAAKNVEDLQLSSQLWSQTLYPVGNGLPLDITDIRPEEIESVIAAGSNIGAEDLNDPRLLKFAAAIKAQLNHLGDTSFDGTLSPEGNGWPLHVDMDSVFSLQCEGRKRFLVSPEPVVEWPCGSIIFSEDGTVESFLYENEPWEEIGRVDTSNLIEVVMEPGDLLYWPAGTLHATKALSKYTLNLALGLVHANFIDLVSRALERALKSNPAWRHLPPVNGMNARPGELPAEVRKFISARLAELHEAIDALSLDSSELNRQWQKSIADPGKPMLSFLSSNSAKPNGKPIGRKDLLRVSRKAPITCAMGTDKEGESGIDIFFAGKEFSTGGEWMPFLKTMLDKQVFTAAQARTWAENGRRYPWKVVREYLEALLAQGFLERVED